ncbi:MAG: DedA family protein [Planctomycetaceae bacterium]|nr:DedA family protein [Planctomycetaceae bacterium]
MEQIKYLIDWILHIDRQLTQLSHSMGGWLYAFLFAIVFCETGLIVTPFLPGDSLLFAVGALVAIPETNLNLGLMFVLLTAAAILGDAVNYSAGRFLGPKVFHSESSRLLNRKHLLKAQDFYERYGGKAIFLARFVPIIRTFAPFVAGIGKMNTIRFWTWNVSGAVVWVGLFLFLGYGFGNMPLIKRYFTLVIFGIIGVSVLPILIEWYRARRGSADTANSVTTTPESNTP